MNSRLLLLTCASLVTGCFYVTHQEGYRVRYGRGQWVRGSIGVGRIASALGRKDWKDWNRLADEGIFPLRTEVVEPLPTHGRYVSAGRITGRHSLIVCVRLSEKGRQRVLQWRRAGRTEDLMLSTHDGEMELAFLEIDTHGSWWDYQHKVRDLRHLVDGNVQKLPPEHVIATCTAAEGTFTVYGIATEGGYLHLNERSHDLLERYENGLRGRRPRDAVPIDFKAVGTFRTPDGRLEDREVSIQYARWGYRLHFGVPSE